MKAALSSAIAIAIAIVLGAAPALAGDFGGTGMRAGGSKTMQLSPSAHFERICNGYFSSGTVVARINGGAPKNLPAGACVETYAQTMTIENPQGGVAHIFYGRSGKQNI